MNLNLLTLMQVIILAFHTTELLLVCLLLNKKSLGTQNWQIIKESFSFFLFVFYTSI